MQQGVEQPETVNERAVSKYKRLRKGLMPVEEYVRGIREGNRVVLSQAITLIESALPLHQSIAQEIIAHCLHHAGKSMRIGITGVPGVGKSTFIEAFGTYLTGKGRKVAVLAIDPSSQRSKGSILGDKTRMEMLSTDGNAFIRPSPSAGSLGGVARKTRETLILCEAAGFDLIIIETVGVGQSETAVHAMVDFFLLLMLPGAGDELQGIKRGIMEMADAILINKADGEQVLLAKLAKTQYSNALHLFPPSPSGWMPVVETCSARTGDGIERTWEIISEYRQMALDNGYFQNKRLEQARQIMFSSIEEQLKQDFYRNPEVNRFLASIEKDLRENKISSYMAARKLLMIYAGHRRKE
ncbi:MAG: methylmalonyl Co-A mutase-associated GTPase MeaB [Bacteroidetes bacterium]|nr:methylmalonyl Co-A mutase-associated GTPase MeaB [Bacteroidota bacterium]